MEKRESHYSKTPLLHNFQLRLPNRWLRLSFLHHGSADWLAFLDEFDLAMRAETGSGRDQVTHDHVFLEPA